jgi:PII-like signaling protein
MVRMSIFLRSCDSYRGRPLHAEIVERARAAGLPGASVMRGLESFGGSGRVHSAGWAGVRDGVPLMIDIIAAAVRVRAFLPVLDELTGAGLVILSPVTLTRPDSSHETHVTFPRHGERSAG